MDQQQNLLAAAAATGAESLVLCLAKQLRNNASMPPNDVAALAAAAAAAAAAAFSTTPLYDVLSVPARLTCDHGPHVLLAVEAIARALLLGGIAAVAVAAAAAATVNLPGPHKETPLHVAIEATVTYTLNAYRELSERKPHKAVLHSFRRDWLCHASLSVLLPRLIQTLLDAGADRTAINDRGMAPVHFMRLACNQVTLVPSRGFLTQLLDVRLVNVVAGECGRTLLHDACAVSDIGAVKLLLHEYGANAHAVDNEGLTALDRVRHDTGTYSCAAKMVLEALLLRAHKKKRLA